MAFASSGMASLLSGNAVQFFFADQVISAGDDHLLVLGQVNQEGQVRQHGLGDRPGDVVVDLIGVGLARQVEKRVQASLASVL